MHSVVCLYCTVYCWQRVGCTVLFTIADGVIHIINHFLLLANYHLEHYSTYCTVQCSLVSAVQTVIPCCVRFFFIVFYSGMDASHSEICFFIHSQYSCRPSGDCGGSRDRTRNCCVAVWFTQSRLSQLSLHIPRTEPPHPTLCCV
jgi:hypothetical protein